jgi:hypothetical protein
MAMDDPVTVMVVATTVTWAAAASMVVAAAVDSMAVVVVDSTAAVVATAVADTGNSSGVDQNEAAAGFHPCSRFFLSSKTRIDRYPNLFSACLVAS